MKNENEYISFMTTKDQNLSASLEKKVLTQISKDLKFEKRNLEIKILFMYVFAGLMTLFICPQFGWNPFSISPHLAHVFMSYGPLVCGAFCGAIFMGSGSLLVLLFIRKNDWNLYKPSAYFRHSALTSLFIVVLMISGLKSQSFSDEYLSATFVSFWAIGSVLVHFFCLKMKQILKIRLS
jgi:hypothetical protein